MDISWENTVHVQNIIFLNIDEGDNPVMQHSSRIYISHLGSKQAWQG